MTQEAIYSVGEQVKLKSGGPVMTVSVVLHGMNQEFNGYYHCQWFAGKKLDQGKFHQDSLEKVEPSVQ